MAEASKIEWTKSTFNPWIGCTRVSPGCDGCYAAVSTPARAMNIEWGPGKPRHRTSEATWNQVRKWNAKAAATGEFWPVFTASLADIFDNEIDPAWRADFWALVRECPNLTFQIVTKRIGNASRMLPDDWGNGYPNVWLLSTIVNQEEADRDIPKLLSVPAVIHGLSMEPLLEPVAIDKYLDPWTCSNCGHHGSEAASGACRCDDCNIEAIYDASIGSARCPSCGKDDGTHDRVGNSCPACEWVYGWSRDYGFMFDSEKPSLIDWVIVGGESGHNARPMHPDWARSLRDHCEAAGVPFLFKQWGEFIVPEDGHQACRVCGCTWNNACSGGCSWVEKDLCSACVGGTRPQGDRAVKYRRVGKKAAGRMLDGRTWDEFPEVLA